MQETQFQKLILKTEYLPPIATFWAICRSEEIVIEYSENYQKKSTRNRAKILGTNGINILSVPLKSGKNSKQSIGEVKISYDENWQRNHLHAIRSAYGNSPYFDFYFDSIAQIIRTQHLTLVDLNTKLCEFFLDTLGIDKEILPTNEYIHTYDQNELDLRKAKFQTNDIPHYEEKRYNQVFEEKHGFVGSLSILDLLMCKGPESILYI